MRMRSRNANRRLTPQFSGILGGFLLVLLFFSLLPALFFMTSLYWRAIGAAIALIWAIGAALLIKWSDCPACGRSAFRYPADMPWWKRGGRLYDSWPARECSDCGYRLDSLNGSHD